MDFKKKLKWRLWTAIAVLVFGVSMIVIALTVSDDNGVLSSFGAAMAVVGAARIRQYALITRSEESIRQREIAETDERNIAIADKAKSVAFMVFMLVACVAVIVLETIGLSWPATIVSSAVCLLLVTYWIAYAVLRRRM